MRRTLLQILILFFSTNLLAQPISGAKGFVSVPSFTFGKVVFIPLNSLAQAYHFKETWDPKTKIATIESSNSKFSFRAGSSIAWINGKIAKMPAEAKMYNGRLLIPYQFGAKLVHPVTASTTEQKTVQKTSLNSKSSFAVLIDPGHGGYDTGAKGKKGLHEKHINLDIAKRLQKKLQKSGFRVFMTRNRDQYVSLWQRCSLSKTIKPHLFISIHTNAARSRAIYGIEIFYLSMTNSKVNGPFHKQNLWKSYRFAKRAQYDLCKTLKAYNRGVKSARFFVLRNAVVPSALIEVGFITNQWEEKKLIDAAYRDQIAQAIADAVYHYKTNNK